MARPSPPDSELLFSGPRRLCLYLASIAALGAFVACAPESKTDEASAASMKTGIAPAADPASTVEAAEPPAPAVNREAIVANLHKGIDVSRHSGVIDWQEVVDQGHGFAFAKATEGVDLEDSSFEDFWQAMNDAGVVRGAYHFYVTEDDPLEQATFFISKVDLKSGDLAPVVDLELIGHSTQPGLADRLSVFLDALENHYGVLPIIYTSPNFWDQHMTDAFGEYPLWIAQYDVEEPKVPKGWAGWHLWQWRGDARIPGIEKDVDLSHVNRDHPDLVELVIP